MWRAINDIWIQVNCLEVAEVSVPEFTTKEWMAGLCNDQCQLTAKLLRTADRKYQFHCGRLVEDR
jgi:hypothetical protein